MNRRNQLKGMDEIQRAMVTMIRTQQPAISRQIARHAFRVAAKMRARELR